MRPRVKGPTFEKRAPKIMVSVNYVKIQTADSSDFSIISAKFLSTDDILFRLNQGALTL